MKNENMLNELEKLSRDKKEELLKFLLNLATQEMLNSQEPVFVFPQKGD